jgi:hypothetical protein
LAKHLCLSLALSFIGFTAAVACQAVWGHSYYAVGELLAIGVLCATLLPALALLGLVAYVIVHTGRWAARQLDDMREGGD